MFCVQCGGELKVDQKFCPACGYPNGEQKKEFPHNVLIRRAHEFSETYDVSLDIPGLSVWEFSRIDEFDPLHKLAPFKRDLMHDLMAFSKYEFSQETIEEIVEEIYPISRKILLTNLKMWFLEQCKTFVDRSNGEFTYNITAIADSNIKNVYGLSKYLTIVTCELKDWEGLQATKSFLKIAEAFYCKNHESYGRQFIRDGQLLRLREFSEARQRYDDLIKEINEAIVRFNPNLKKEIDQEIKTNDVKEAKIRKTRRKSILTRVICGLTYPFLLALQYLILPEFGVRFDSFPKLVVIIVAAILCGLLLVADINIRNIPLIITLNVIGLLLFFPLCWGISTLVAWLSKIFMFILAGGVILMVFFLHGDRMKP